MNTISHGADHVSDYRNVVNPEPAVRAVCSTETVQLWDLCDYVEEYRRGPQGIKNGETGT